MIKRPWQHNNLKESFMGALKGIIVVIKNERYAKIVFLFGILAILSAIALRASLLEIAILTVVIIVVLISETFNAVVENVLDIIKPYRDPHVKILKEVAAATVLLSSFGAAIVGIAIFLPKIACFFR
jgi:diacylglycerol kinase